MPIYGMFIDPLYLVVLLVTLVISGVASAWVKMAYSKWSKVRSGSGLTGAEAARRILEANGLHDVKVEAVDGFLTDHYDPRSRTLRLSPKNFQGQSVAAIGVAAHETGHALQHAKNYAPLGLRSYLAVPASFGSNLGFAAIFLGMILQWQGMMLAGVILFGLMVLFQFVTLPVEINASTRAVRFVDEYDLAAGPEERKGVKKVLRAAAWTYVAAAITSLLYLLYFILRMYAE